ncbi:hypothetical protein MHYP_G00216440 [Metynnis hypsauchen]
MSSCDCEGLGRTGEGDRHHQSQQNTEQDPFFGKATLTTTVQTTIEPVPDAGLAAEAVRDDAQLVCGEIFSSDVVLEYYRPRRRLLNGVQPGTLMTRCHQCSAFVKNAETSTEIEGKISVVDERGDQCSISVD